jgi:hypothetical protein
MKVGDLVSLSAYGQKLTMYYKVNKCLGIITDIRGHVAGSATERAELDYLVEFTNGCRHYAYRKEIKYAK